MRWILSRKFVNRTTVCLSDCHIWGRMRQMSSFHSWHGSKLAPSGTGYFQNHDFLHDAMEFFMFCPRVTMSEISGDVVMSHRVIGFRSNDLLWGSLKYLPWHADRDDDGVDENICGGGLDFVRAVYLDFVLVWLVHVMRTGVCPCLLDWGMITVINVNGS